MKRLGSLFSLALVAVLVLGSVGQALADPGDPGGKVRVLVEFAPGSKGAAAQALAGLGGEVHYEFDALNTIAVSVPAAALDGLSRNPNVVFIEEDAPRYPISVMRSAAAAPQAVSLAEQVAPYGVDLVQARDVWDADRDGAVDAGAPTGAGRKVCIIDSGFWTGHEDFQGIDVTGYNGNLPWNTDGDGHGSHVAGTIAAVNNALGVVGVTPGAVSLYIVRVFGDDGLWAYSSTLVDAANRCAGAGANIISMSLGGGRATRAEKTTFANLYAQGILSVAAAGNDGTSTLSYPASYDSVLSVAAVDANEAWADFSQFNAAVDLAAPGVGVLSTVPYLEVNTLTVDRVTYLGNHIEFAARGAATGALVNGGLCDTVGAWSGQVVLCERGTISFYDKVHNVQLGGGAAAVIYNNAPGNFLGTLGEGFSSTIPAISLSQEDGQYLAANKLGQSGDVSSSVTKPASSYEYYDGTSMATPHVSAVAALVWSARPSATNAEVRAALIATAKDLGTAGRDNYFGNGLVQAKAAIAELTYSPVLSVLNLEATKTLAKANWKATVTITVKDADGAVVSGVVVAGTFNTTAVACTTGADGKCSVTSASLKNTVPSVTYTVTNLTRSAGTYDETANVLTSLVITK